MTKTFQQDAMNYESWLKTVPLEITGDPLWNVEAYRLALFLADLCWRDDILLPDFTHHSSLVNAPENAHAT